MKLTYFSKSLIVCLLLSYAQKLPILASDPTTANPDGSSTTLTGVADQDGSTPATPGDQDGTTGGDDATPKPEEDQKEGKGDDQGGTKGDDQGGSTPATPGDDTTPANPDQDGSANPDGSSPEGSGTKPEEDQSGSTPTSGDQDSQGVSGDDTTLTGGADQDGSTPATPGDDTTPKPEEDQKEGKGDSKKQDRSLFSGERKQYPVPKLYKLKDDGTTEEHVDSKYSYASAFGLSTFVLDPQKNKCVKLELGDKTLWEYDPSKERRYPSQVTVNVISRLVLVSFTDKVTYYYDNNWDLKETVDYKKTEDKTSVESEDTSTVDTTPKPEEDQETQKPTEDTTPVPAEDTKPSTPVEDSTPKPEEEDGQGVSSDVTATEDSVVSGTDDSGSSTEGSGANLKGSE